MSEDNSNAILTEQAPGATVNVQIVNVQPQRGNPNFYKGMPKPAALLKGRGTTLGRRRRLFAYVERIAKKHNLETADPAEILIYIGATGKDPLEENYRALVSDAEWDKFFPKNEENFLYRDKDGWVRVRGFIKPETRIDCLKAVMPYLHPRLTATEPPSDENEKTSFEDRSKIMQGIAADPEVRAAMETLTERTAMLRLQDRSEQVEPEPVEQV